MNKILNYINGKKDAVSSNFQDIINPATGEKISEVVLSNEKDFEKSLNSSINSQIIWSDYTPLRRSRIISKFKELIEKNMDELAKLI